MKRKGRGGKKATSRKGTRKGTRKKATRKKATRKKGARKGTSQKKSGTKVIHISAGYPTPLKPHTKKNHRVRWVSDDNQPYWIKFLLNTWPFQGARQLIAVSADGQPTKWLKVSVTAPPGGSISHRYAVKLDPNDPDPPPDGPDIIVD